jgi:CheY-like chemotaxis protein
VTTLHKGHYRAGSGDAGEPKTHLPLRGLCSSLRLALARRRRRAQVEDVHTLPQTNALDRTKILFVDDEEFAASAIKLFLELSGFQVITARHGLDALAYIAEAQPDVVVLDAIMPRLDGWETLRRLRQQDDATPVILLLQTPGREEEIRARHEGADDYLVKPYEAAELAERIRMVLQRTS